MSCQILNVLETFQLIPNGSPKFLTKSTRNAWETSKYYTSWIAEDSSVTTTNDTPMFSRKTQPPQLHTKERKTHTGHLLMDLFRETPIRKKQLKDGDKHKYTKKTGKTLDWWNSIADLPTGGAQWWNPSSVAAKDESLDEDNDNQSSAQDDDKKKTATVKARMRNYLPIPKTILGAFDGDAVLVRLRSVVDSDLLVSADDVSPVHM